MKSTSHQLKFQSVTSQIREHVEAQLRGAVLSTINGKSSTYPTLIGQVFEFTWGQG